MQQTLFFTMEVVPDVAKRGRHALILLRNKNGDYVLGSKSIYPDSIYRMVGGGIEVTEDPNYGAVRELKEETGLELRHDKVKHLGTITAQIDEVTTKKHYTFETELFFVYVGDKKLYPSDDVDALEELSDADMVSLIERYKDLPKEIDPDKGFAWYDYGQLYAVIHQIALDEARRIKTRK